MQVRSTSRTAGHTKYLQHIPLHLNDDEEAKLYYGVEHMKKDLCLGLKMKDVYLIDCPGLVFPQSAPRHIGEAMGLYPIAQVREYLSVIRFVGERISLDNMYGLKIPDWYENDEEELMCGSGGGSGGCGGGGGGGRGGGKGGKGGRGGGGRGGGGDGEWKGMSSSVTTTDSSSFNILWTPRMILEAYSIKKKYFQGKGGIPDITRAGTEILKDIVDGIVLLSFAPPVLSTSFIDEEEE